VAEESDFDPLVEVIRDPSGRSYDNAYLDELADEAERLGPPQVRRGRPPLGATSGGHSPRLSTRVPRDVDDAVRAAAEREGVTPAQWLREAIEQRLVRG
jgi:plasmid stabilization system protein ParE